VGAAPKTGSDFGVIVAPKPGELIQARRTSRRYDRSKDGDNLPPFAAPVARALDFKKLQVAAEAILQRPAAKAALKRLFGASG